MRKISLPAKAAILMLICQLTSAADLNQQSELIARNLKPTQPQSGTPNLLQNKAKIEADESMKCWNDHKGQVLFIIGVSFFVGCLVTALSMGLGFAYYLRSQERENYKAYELEMADETLPLDEEDTISARSPGQK